MPSKATATLSPKQVADELGVNEKTVRNWIHAGVVEAYRTPAGRYLLAPSLVPVLKKLNQQMPLNTRALRGQLPQEDRPPPT